MSTNPPAERGGSEDQRFDSWKEIAAYLCRSEKTVRRWEETEGLLVHRLVHEKRGSVYGYRSELDAWRESRKEANRIEESPLATPLPGDHPPPSESLSPSPATRASMEPLPGIEVPRLEIDKTPVGPALPAIASGTKPSNKNLWLVVGTGALLIAAGAAVWQGMGAPPQEIWSGVMLGGPAKAFEPRLSPNGQLLAFLALIDHQSQLAVMKPGHDGWNSLTSDRAHGSIVTIAWAPDGSRIYFDRVCGYPLAIYSVLALGGAPRTVLEDAFGPEPLPDGSLIVVKMTDQGDNQLFHFWPESNKLEALPAFLQGWSDITPMVRAFPDGKELVYFGTSEKDRFQSAHMLVLDLVSRQVRDLAPGLRIDPRADGWAPLNVRAGGKSVYVVSRAGDTEWLVEVPRDPGRKPRALFSFPDSAMPVGMDSAQDGSIYLDLLRNQFVVLRVNAAGAVSEEYGLPTDDYPTTVSPAGDVLVTLPGWGRQRLAAVRPQGEPRVLVESSEDTMLPATTFDGKVAFVIGRGDQRRIAVASLRDGRVLRRFSTRSDNGMSASPDGHTLYYSFSGIIWAQPVAGGDPKRITEGNDVTIDPKGKYLYVKRVGIGLTRIMRIPVAGGEAEELPIPAEYRLANPGLSPAAVDARGRILVTVASKDSFYYKTAILDPSSKSFATVPVAIDGDAAMAGWAPDGRIFVRGHRYFFSLWRYQVSKALN